MKLPGTFDISVGYASPSASEKVGEVVEFINHTGHTAPLMKVLYEDMSEGYLLAPEGVKTGDRIHITGIQRFTLGSVIKIGDIPEGVPIFNIESRPGDGGKFVRSAGGSAYGLSPPWRRRPSVQLPSKNTVALPNECRAQLGIVAGGGMVDQPIVKAGKNHYRKHAVNRTWPTIRGVKMNPVDHPFGGKQHHKGKSSMTSIRTG